MPELYRNTGCAFTAEDGTLIGPGQVFAPSARDLARRRYKLRPTGFFTDPPPVPVPPVPPAMFPGVDFASDAAYAAARDAGLVSEDFAGREGSGHGGAFVKADVEALIAERG